MTEPQPFQFYQAPEPGWQHQQAAKPGTIPLRPLSVSDILGGAVATIRGNWQVMFLVPLVVGVVLQAAQIPILLSFATDFPKFAPTGNSRADSARVAEQLGSFLLSFLGKMGLSLGLAAVFNLLLLGVLTVTACRAVLGQKLSLPEALKAAGPRYLPLIGLLVVIGLMQSLAFVVPTGIGVLLAASTHNLGGIAFVFLFALLGFGLWAWLYVTFVFAPTALLLEPQPIGRALSRSRWLVRGQWWRVFGVLVLANLIAGAVGYVAQLPVSAIQALTMTTSISARMNPDPAVLMQQAMNPSVLIASAIVGAVVVALTTPFVISVNVLLYHDQRIRSERFDIPLAQMTGVAPPPVQPQ